MTSNSPNKNDTDFKTPDPTSLQADEEKNAVRDRYHGYHSNPSDLTDPDEVGPFGDKENAAGANTFDPDEVSRSATDAAVNAEDRQAGNLLNRQAGIVHRSGS